MSSLHIDSFSEAFLDTPFVATICDAELRPSPIAGKGLFSLRPRAREEILCVLDGQEIDPRHHPRVMDELEWNALSPTRLLVRPLRTSYGYINHSVDPNVRVGETGFSLHTTRAIAAGEEFTMDYFAQPVPQAYLASAEGLRLLSAGAATAQG